MKTKLSLILLIIFCVAFPGQEIKKNIVKTNLTAYAFRNFNLTYERALKK